MPDYRQPGFYAQAEELILQRGFRGIAIPGHRLLGKPLTDDEMMRMFRLMEEKDIVLSITLEDGDRQVSELSEVISDCPQLRIAIGHLGMANPPQTPCWENPSWRRQIALAQHPQVMIEMGGITWLYNAEFYPFPSAVRAIREVIDIAGADNHYRHHLPHVVRLYPEIVGTLRCRQTTDPGRERLSVLRL